MSTTNTEFNWYWYIRKKDRKYYLGLFDENGDDATGAYTIQINYDEIPDEVDSDDDTIPIPIEYEMPIIKAVAAEIATMETGFDKSLIALWRSEYQDCINNAIHNQIGETSQPLVLKPFDFRDDD